MRNTQLTMNIMRTYQMLVNKKHEHYEEGQNLHYKLEGKVALKHLKQIEEQLGDMRTKLNTERTQRWRNWVDNSWGHTKIKTFTSGLGERKKTDLSLLTAVE
eukprot:12130100-Heterocapsa_arctica.AAC.1